MYPVRICSDTIQMIVQVPLISRISTTCVVFLRHHRHQCLIECYKNPKRRGVNPRKEGHQNCFGVNLIGSCLNELNIDIAIYIGIFFDCRNIVRGSVTKIFHQF